MYKILHLIDKLSMDGVNPSSCAQCLVDWIKHRDRQRFEVVVAVLRRADAGGKYLEAKGVRVLYVGKGKYSLANVGAVSELIRQEHADLLHLHGYGAANFGRVAARQCGIPSVMHEHAVLKTLPHQYAVDWLLRNRTDVAVGVSANVRDFMIRGRSVSPNKVRVIWNGVDLDNFKTVETTKVRAFREQFGIAEQQRVIGTVTRLREEKGNRYFIDAAAQVLRECPDARFIVAGEGPQRDLLEREAKSLALDGKLHFAGFVSDVTVAFAAMDIAVMPSLSEGFPLALAEAMAAGKPVVATNVGAMKEMIQDETSGLLVPPADGASLANALVRLLKDPALQHRLAQGARVRSADFNIARSARALEALYSEMLAPTRGPVPSARVTENRTKQLPQHDA